MRDYLTIGTVPCNEDCTQNEPTGAYAAALETIRALGYTVAVAAPSI